MAVAGHKVKVGVRARPLNQREITAGAKINWKIGPQTIQSIDQETQKLNPKGLYNFDNVFGPEVATKEVYKDIVAPIVHEAFKGFNGTVLCYGQTSSGKTHTLYGSPNDPGIIDLLAQDIMGRMKEDPSRQFVFKVNLIEIYNETVKDLLNSENPIEIVETLNGVVPRDIEDLTVLSAEDISKAAQRLQRERKIGETRMNSQSSRSHTIIRITIQIISESVDGDFDSTDSSLSDNGMISAVLNFVDLAGSEKASQSGAVGDRLKEASHINTSLSALSKVVMQLSDKWENESRSSNTSVCHSLGKPNPKSRIANGFVSYRDSKLTRLLQSSLDGDALVAIICNVTPASLEETTSTLRFATSAKKIHTKPKQHIIAPTDKSKYENKIQELQYQLFGKNTELVALRQTLLRYVSNDSDVLGGERRMTICPGTLFNQGPHKMDIASDEFSKFSIPKSRRSIGNPYPEIIDSAEALKQFRAAKVNQTAKKIGNPASLIPPSKSDQEAQTDFDGVPAKRRRLDNEEIRTPVSTLRMQRSMMCVALDEDRNQWKEEKEFLESEIQILQREIKELNEQIVSKKKDEDYNLKLSVELDLLKCKYLTEMEQLKSSKEYEVDTLNEQIQKKNTIIKNMQTQLKERVEKQQLHDPSLITAEAMRLLKEEVDEEKVKLSNAYEELKCSYSSLEELNHSKQFELDALKSQIQNIEQDKLNISNDFDALKLELSQTIEDLKIVKESEKALKIGIQNNEEEKLKLSTALELMESKYSNEIEQLKNSKEHATNVLTVQIQTIEQDKLKISNDFEALHLELSHSMKDLEIVKESEKVLNMRITNNEEEKLKLSKALDSLESKHSDEIEQLKTSKEREMNDLTMQIKSLEQEKLKIINDFDSLKLELSNTVEKLKVVNESEKIFIEGIQNNQEELKASEALDLLESKYSNEIEQLKTFNQREMNDLTIQIQNIEQDKLKIANDFDVLQLELSHVIEELKIVKESEKFLKMEIKNNKEENLNPPQASDVLEFKDSDEIKQLKTSNEREMNDLTMQIQTLEQEKLKISNDFESLKLELSNTIEKLKIVEDSEKNLNMGFQNNEKEKLKFSDALDLLESKHSDEIQQLKNSKKREMNALSTQIQSIEGEKFKVFEELNALKLELSHALEKLKIFQESEEAMKIRNQRNDEEKLKLSAALDLMESKYSDEIEQLKNSLEHEMNNMTVQIQNIELEKSKISNDFNALKLELSQTMEDLEIVKESEKVLNMRIKNNEEEKLKLSKALEVLEFKYSDEIEQLKNSNEREMNIMTVKIQNIELEKSKISNDFNAMKLELSQTMEDLEIVKESEKVLNMRIKNNKEEKLKLSKALDSLESKHSDEIEQLKTSKEREMNDLIVEIQNIKEEKLKTLYDLNELKLELSQTVEKLKIVQESEKFLNMEIQRNKDEKLKLSTALDLLESKHSDEMEQFKISKERERNDLIMQIQNIELEKLNVSENLDAIKSEYADEIEKLNSSKESALNYLNEKIQNIENDKLKLSEELNARTSILSEEIEQLKIHKTSEVNSLNAQIETQNSLIRNLQTNTKCQMDDELGLDSNYIKTIQDDVQSFKNQITNLKISLQERDENIHSTAEEIRLLTSEVTELRNCRDLLTAKILEKNSENVQSSKEQQEGNVNFKYMEKLKEELKTCWKENQILEDQISNLKLTLQGKEREFDCINNDLHELKSGRTLKPAVLESLYAELEELRQNNDKLKTNLNQMSESLRISSEENKELNLNIEQLRNVRRPSKINRGSQTPDEWDLQLEKRNHDLRVRLKCSIFHQEKSEKKIVELTSENNRNVSKLQDQMAEKTKRIEELESYIRTNIEQQKTVRERQVEVGVQCQYIEELLVRAKGGEAGLLPPEFPDVGQLVKDIERLQNKSHLLDTALRRCQCNVEKNNRVLKLYPSIARKENPEPKSFDREETAEHKPFVSRMGSAADRKRPEWQRGITSKTPSPSVFPKSLSLRPPCPLPEGSHVPKKVELFIPSCRRIPNLLKSAQTSQLSSHNLNPEEVTNIAKEFSTASKKDEDSKTTCVQPSEPEKSTDSENKSSAIKVSNVLKDSNQSVTENHNPLVSTPGVRENVPYKSILDDDNIITPDEYFDWLMSQESENPKQ